MAGFRFFHPLVMGNSDASALHGFIADGLREERTERIAAKDADDEGLFLIGESVCGPLGELGEMEEKYCANLVFTRGSLRAGRQGEGQEKEDEEDGGKLKITGAGISKLACSR